MSLFSSLIVFYPGSPPAMKLQDARRFCDRLRSTLSLGDDLLGVDIKYGKAIDQDGDTTNKMEWDATGTIGRCVAYEWDHGKRRLPWTQLWPSAAFDLRNLYRAYVGLGGLPQSITLHLRATGDKPGEEYIAPDSLSFQIDPVIPATLNADELVAYGYVQLSFAGNGYFSWQPLSDYWLQARTSSSLQTVLDICRETFPVPTLTGFDRIANRLGELFLNGAEYRPGDWIVSVSETG